jgi:hypothetical protein
MCKQALQEYCFPSGMTHEVQLIKTRPSKRYMTYQINAGHPTPSAIQASTVLLIVLGSAGLNQCFGHRLG